MSSKVRVTSTYIRHGLQYRVHVGGIAVGPLFSDKADAEAHAETLRECSFCVEHAGKMAPPHNASPRCESGGHSHCTCDRCF
jgi:hypothetical protein